MLSWSSTWHWWYGGLYYCGVCGGLCAAPTPVTAPICAACIGAYAVLGAGVSLEQ